MVIYKQHIHWFADFYLYHKKLQGFSALPILLKNNLGFYFFFCFYSKKLYYIRIKSFKKRDN